MLSRNARAGQGQAGRPNGEVCGKGETVSAHKPGGVDGSVEGSRLMITGKFARRCNTKTTANTQMLQSMQKTEEEEEEEEEKMHKQEIGSD